MATVYPPRPPPFYPSGIPILQAILATVYPIGKCLKRLANAMNHNGSPFKFEIWT